MSEDRVTAEEEEYAFYHEVGATLMQWAFVESALMRVVIRCADGDGRTGALLAIGFRSIENFRSKIAYADKLITHHLFFEHVLLARWKANVKRLSSSGKRRNQIAHGQALQIPEGKPGQRIALFEPGWFLKATTAPYITGAKLYIREIASINTEFVTLHQSLWNFYRVMVGEPEQYPESREQEVHQPTIRSIEARMHAAIGRPPQPFPK